MKILFYRYNNICEPDIIEVFRKFEIHVCEEWVESQMSQGTYSEKIKKLAENYVTESAKGKIDFIFSVNFFPHVSEFCERLKIRYVCWSVDCPVLELYSNSVKNRQNRIFLFDEIQYCKIHALNPECVYYLPLATNVERWDEELRTMTLADKEKYSADISFVGSLYHEKSPLTILKERMPLSEYLEGYINGATEAQLWIYGTNFLEELVTEEVIDGLKAAFPDFYSSDNKAINTDSFVAANYYLGMRASEMERIRILNTLATENKVTVYTRSDVSLLKNVECKSGITTHIEMPRVFRNSKINLNITMKGIQSGIPLRIWDVLGCGGFLLTNYQAEIPSYLEIGTDLECYESPKECMEKVRYYLKHDDIRRQIADNGYRKVKELHTYEHRIADMIGLLLQEM